MQALRVEYSHHEGQAAHDSPTTDAGKAGCLKFCDDESSTFAKSKTAQTDLLGPVVVASVEWRSTVPKATATMWRSAGRPAPSQGPPLVIRFMRLTI